jgi:hypothetical protein
LPLPLAVTPLSHAECRYTVLFVILAFAADSSFCRCRRSRRRDTPIRRRYAAVDTDIDYTLTHFFTSFYDAIFSFI